MGRLTEKVGPLPVWAWGTVVGVIILGYVFFSNRGGAVTGESSGGSTVTGTAMATDGLIPVNIDGRSSLDTGDVRVTPDEATNSQWLAQAVRYSLESNYTAIQAEAALRKYLMGMPLTAMESTIVNRAVDKLGLPPDGVSGIPAVEDATPTPTPEPAKPVTAAESTPRRQAIADMYRAILGRTPSRVEINFWDAQPFDIEGIRKRILGSQEAKTTKR